MRAMCAQPANSATTMSSFPERHRWHRRLQGAICCRWRAMICACSTTSILVRRWCAASPRAASVRAMCRTGPARSETRRRHNYVGGTIEVQFPIWGLPKDIGLRGALFSDAGSLWDYRGPTNFSKYLYGVPNLPCVYPYSPPNYGQGSCMILSGQEFRLRSSVGAGLLWQSRLVLSASTMRSRHRRDPSTSPALPLYGRHQLLTPSTTVG